jgi:hypothetical protein
MFFDPDNGIEVPSVAKGRKKSSKYVYWDEIATAFGSNRSLLIYQHFTREKRQAFVARLAHCLRAKTGAREIWAIYSPHAVFLLSSSDPRISNLAGSLPNLLGLRTDWL